LYKESIDIYMAQCCGDLDLQESAQSPVFHHMKLHFSLQNSLEPL